MKNNLKNINKIIENNFINNINFINKRLYPRPYLLTDENSEEEEPILFI